MEKLQESEKLAVTRHLGWVPSAMPLSYDNQTTAKVVFTASVAHLVQHICILYG